MSPSNGASLSVPPTQNTAAVIKFQCLFTRDVKRKAKRWHDGYLRFHTFNKRIMVYDMPGNLVGDLHWRESAIVQDGDEFELERAVLVQVGEKLESTVTDLSTLLEKRRASPTKAIPPSRSVESRGPDIYPATTNWAAGSKEKSLNELLGINRSSGTGRPVAPARTPLEERLQTNTGYSDARVERPSKRQKVAREPTKTKQSLPGGPESNENESVSESGSRQNRKYPASKAVPGSVATKAIVKDSSVVNVNASFQPASMVEIEPAHNSRQGKKKASKLPANQKSISDMFPTGDKPVTTIQFATERPRSKLLFMDLLVTKKSGTMREPAGKSAGSRSKNRHSKDVDTDDTTLADDNNISETTEISEICSASTSKAGNTRTLQLSSQINKAENDAPPPSQQQSRNLFEYFKPDSKRQQKDTELRHAEDDIESLVDIIPDSPVREEKSSKVLQRSFSTTDSNIPGDLNPGDSMESSKRINPTHQEQQRDPGRTNSLKKSFSDPSALSLQKPIGSRSIQTKLFANNSNAINNTILEDEEEPEQGPWTTEALDLFDWWPPGRPKPNGLGVS